MPQVRRQQRYRWPSLLFPLLIIFPEREAEGRDGSGFRSALTVRHLVSEGRVDRLSARGRAPLSSRAVRTEVFFSLGGGHDWKP